MTNVDQLTDGECCTIYNNRYGPIPLSAQIREVKRAVQFNLKLVENAVGYDAISKIKKLIEFKDIIGTESITNIDNKYLCDYYIIYINNKKIADIPLYLFMTHKQLDFLKVKGGKKHGKQKYNFLIPRNLLTSNSKKAKKLRKYITKPTDIYNKINRK